MCNNQLAKNGAAEPRLLVRISRSRSSFLLTQAALKMKLCLTADVVLSIAFKPTAHEFVVSAIEDCHMNSQMRPVCLHSRLSTRGSSAGKYTLFSGSSGQALFLQN
jgi:hypothetical protein